MLVNCGWRIFDLNPLCFPSFRLALPRNCTSGAASADVWMEGLKCQSFVENVNRF